MTTTYAQLEDAIARVPGVTHVSVGTTNGSGKGRLRIRLAPEANPENVANTVAILLDTNFGIRIPPEAIRPVVGPPPDAGPPEAAPHAPQPQAATPSQPTARAAAPVQTPPSTDPAAGNGSWVDDAVLAAVTAFEQPVPEAPPAAAEPTPQPAAVAHAPAEQQSPPPPPPPGQHQAPAPPPSTPAPGEAADRPVNPELDEVIAAVDQDGAGVDVELPSGAIAPRPLITELKVTGSGLDVFVHAELEINGQTVSGRASCPATLPATLRAVVRATIDALRDLLADEARIELESVSQEQIDGRDSIAVAVTWLTRTSTERLLGVSYLRDDAAHSTMRATLDAVNRRLTQLTEH